MKNSDWNQVSLTQNQMSIFFKNYLQASLLDESEPGAAPKGYQPGQEVEETKTNLSKSTSTIWTPGTTWQLFFRNDKVTHCMNLQEDKPPIKAKELQKLLVKSKAEDFIKNFSSEDQKFLRKWQKELQAPKQSVLTL